MGHAGRDRLGAVGRLSVLCLAGQVMGAEVMTGYLDRSYYTTEREAVAVCSLGTTAKTLADRVLVVRNAAGDVLRQVDAVSPETRIPLNIAGMPTGEHTLKVEIRTNAGEAVSAFELVLEKKDPKPGCEWKVDRIDRVLLRNGEPFFPHGILMRGSEEDFAQAARMGFNTVHTWSSLRKPEHATEYVEWAAKYGLFTIIDITDFFRGVRSDALRQFVSAEELEGAQKALIYAGRSVKKFSYGLTHSSHPSLKKLSEEAMTRLAEEYYENNRADFAAALGLAKDSPNLIGYCLYDEPASFLAPMLGRRMHAQARVTDGYHPSFVIYSSWCPEGDEWVDWLDVLGTDPYWVPGAAETHGTRGTVNYVSKVTYTTKKRADQRRQVTWSVPMGEFYSGIRKRGIMPKEQFCQTYLAVIHGAKAITYFRWPYKCQQTTDTHTALAKQMETIGPIAVTSDIRQAITYDPGEFDPENDEFPDIQVSLRRNPAGGYVLLAANSRYYPVGVTYRIRLLADGTRMKRLFDQQVYDVQDGTFGERVEFLGTRAYAFHSDDPLREPVEISVEMKAYPNQADPVYAAPGLPDTGRPGKRNLIRNPGFEESGLPGWPDYYLLNPPGPRSGPPGSEPGYGLTTEAPYEGKASLWVHAKAGSSPQSTLFYGACSPKLAEDTPFVLSVYMRADRDGVKARFKGFGWRVPKPTFGYKEFTLTTRWERYSEKGTLIPGLPTWHSVGVEILTSEQDVTVFYDALQFEEGTELTEYEP